MDTPDFYALDALSGILSQGRSARLVQNLVDQGLAQEAWAGNPDNRYGGLAVLGGSPKEPPALKNPGLSEEERRLAYVAACEGLERHLLEEVEKLKSEPVSPQELGRIIKMNQREFIDRLRSNESVAGTLATLEVQVGWPYLGRYLENMARVTPEDVQRVARTYFRAENQTTVFVIPGGASRRPPEAFSEVRSIGAGAAGERPLAKGLGRNLSKYPTPAGWKHPLSFERRPRPIDYPAAERLEIGPTPVFFLPDRELPVIDLTIFVKAGTVDLGASEAGLGDLLEASIIRGGTEARPPAELGRFLDENAIRLGFDIGQEESAVTLSVMTSEWEQGLAVLKEVLTRPRFDEKVLEVAKEQAAVQLARSGEDARDVAMREALIWHFQGHPYGRDPLDALKTLPAFSRADLARFLATHFVPENFVVAVAGDIDGEKVRRDLAGFLAGLPGRPAPPRRLAEPEPTPPILTLIHKPGQVQSNLALMLPGLLRTHPDYWKSSLLMSLFGGGDSLLYTRLRDDLGIVYSAGFYQAFKWKAGLLVGSIGCRGDRAGQAVRETLAIMEALRRGIPARELEVKRLDALNSFVFNLDTKADLVRAYSRYQMRGEPLDTLGRIQQAYFDVRREELGGIARRLLVPERIQIHVVADKTTPVSRPGGPARTLGEELETLARDLGLPFREIDWR
jgi:predicted Zn-dependent peptidase